MPSSGEPARRGDSTTETALLQRIEEMSFLGTLNERLARVPDFAAACRNPVRLVCEERYAERVAFVAVDALRAVCTLEAMLPAAADDDLAAELSLTALPFVNAPEPVVIRRPHHLPWFVVDRAPGAALIAA